MIEIPAGRVTITLEPIGTICSNSS